MQQEAKHKEKEEEEKEKERPEGKKKEALPVRGRHRGSLSLLLPAVVPPSPLLPQHKFSPSKNSRPAKSVPHSRQRQKRSRERWGSLYKDLQPHSDLKSLGPDAFNNWRRCHTFENWCPQKAKP